MKNPNMLLKLESEFFSNRNHTLNFKPLRKKTGQLGAWIELGHLVYRDVSSGARRLTFDITNKKVIVAKLLNIVLATEKSRRKMTRTSSERYRRRWQPVCGRGFNGGPGRD